jgi:hypothetical protein
MADNTFGRRRFGALAAGAGLAAAAAPLLTAGSASAAIGKYHGPLLTAGWEEFKAAVAQGRHNLTKVVATWGAPWGDPDFQLALANLTPYTIVRTGTGDTDNVLDPGAVVNEIAPFYQWSTQVRPADRLIIELGNEPNLRHGTDFIQPYADSLHASIDAVQATYFHIDTQSPDPLFQAYNVAPDGPLGYQP